MALDLSTLPLSTFTKFTYASNAAKRAAEKGLLLGRTIHTDAGLFYKTWRSASAVHRTIFIEGKPVEADNKDADGREILLGFKCGLFDEVTCPAFVDHIHKRGRLVGYVTRAGVPVTPQELDTGEGAALVEALIDRSLASGFVLRDLHAGNVIRLNDGRLSLIDLETPLSHLYSLDLDAEVSGGALRRSICQAYRQFVLDFFDIRSTSPRTLEARRELWRRAPIALATRGAHAPAIDGRKGVALMEDYVKPNIKNSHAADLAWIDRTRRYIEGI